MASNPTGLPRFRLFRVAPITPFDFASCNAVMPAGSFRSHDLPL